MADEQHIQVKVEGDASRFAEQMRPALETLNKLNSSLAKASQAMRGLELAQQRVNVMTKQVAGLNGVPKEALAEVAVFQRRARQFAAGDPDTVYARSRQQAELNRIRADGARSQLQIETELERKLKAQITMLERAERAFREYARSRAAYRQALGSGDAGLIATRRGIAEAAINQFPQQMRKQLTGYLETENARLRESIRNSNNRRGAPRRGFGETLIGDYLDNRIDLGRGYSGRDRAQIVTAQVRELQQMRGQLRREAAEIEQAVALRKEANLIERQRVAEARQALRSEREFNRSEQTRFRREVQPILNTTRDRAERERIFNDFAAQSQARAAATGRRVDPWMLGGVYQNYEAARGVGEQARAAKEVERSRLYESGRMERAARSTQAARDRFRVNGGADIFAIQGELLRNYTMQGAAIGSAGYLLNFTRNYEAELAQLQAISGSTAGEMAKLERIIAKTAETSKFAALDIVQASTVMAQAGLSAAQISQTLPKVLELATATGTDLNTTVDAVTSTMTVFKLQTSEAAAVTDVLTNAMNRSKLDVTKFALGLQYAGNIAADSGLSYIELTAALAGMSNQGIKAGSTLGTGLRQLLTDLKTPTDKAREHFERMGLSMSDLDVKANGLFGVLRNMQRAGYTSADAMQTLEVRSAAAYTALVNNLPGLELLRSQLTTAGAASKGAATQLDTFNAAWTQFTNSAGLAFEKVVKPLLKSLTFFVRVMTELAKAVGWAAPAISALVPPLVLLGVARLVKDFGALVKGLIDTTEWGGRAKKALAGVAGAWGGFGGGGPAGGGPAGPAPRGGGPAGGAGGLVITPTPYPTGPGTPARPSASGIYTRGGAWRPAAPAMVPPASWAVINPKYPARAAAMEAALVSYLNSPAVTLPDRFQELTAARTNTDPTGRAGFADPISKGTMAYLSAEIRGIRSATMPDLVWGPREGTSGITVAGNEFGPPSGWTTPVAPIRTIEDVPGGSYDRSIAARSFDRFFGGPAVVPSMVGERLAPARAGRRSFRQIELDYIQSRLAEGPEFKEGPATQILQLREQREALRNQLKELEEASSLAQTAYQREFQEGRTRALALAKSPMGLEYSATTRRINELERQYGQSVQPLFTSAREELRQKYGIAPGRMVPPDSGFHAEWAQREAQLKAQNPEPAELAQLRQREIALKTKLLKAEEVELLEAGRLQQVTIDVQKSWEETGQRYVQVTDKLVAAETAYAATINSTREKVAASGLKREAAAETEAAAAAGLKRTAFVNTLQYGADGQARLPWRDRLALMGQQVGRYLPSIDPNRMGNTAPGLFGGFSAIRPPAALAEAFGKVQARITAAQVAAKGFAATMQVQMVAASRAAAGAILAAGASMKAMIASMLATPFTSFMVGVGVLISGAQIWSMVFKDAKAKSEELSSEIQDLEGKMNATGESLNAVTDQISKMTARNVDLTTSGEELVDNQARLQDIIDETRIRFEGLGFTLDKNVTSMADLRQASIELQQELAQTMAMQAQMVIGKAKEKENTNLALFRRRAAAFSTIGESANFRTVQGVVDGRINLRSLNATDRRILGQIVQLTSSTDPDEQLRMSSALMQPTNALSGKVRDAMKTARGSERERLLEIYRVLQSTTRKMSSAAEPMSQILDARATSANATPGYAASLVMQAPGYAQAKEQLEAAQTRLNDESRKILAERITASEKQTKLQALQQDPQLRLALTNLTTATEAMQKSVTENMVAAGYTQEQAARYARNAISSGIGAELSQFRRRLDKSIFEGDETAGRQIETQGQATSTRAQSQIRALIQRIRTKKDVTPEFANSEVNRLTDEELAGRLLAFDTQNGLGPSDFQRAEFADSALGIARQEVKDKVEADREARLNMIIDAFQRGNGRRGSSAVQSLAQFRTNRQKEGLDTILGNIGRIDDETQLKELQQAYETKFEAFKAARLELFEKTWDNTQWANAAEANEAKSESRRQLEQQLDEQAQQASDRFADRMTEVYNKSVDVLMKRLDDAVEEAKRDLDKSLRPFDLGLALQDGRLNRGRFGDVERNRIQRQREEYRISRLPDIIAPAQARIGSLEDALRDNRTRQASETNPTAKLNLQKEELEIVNKLRDAQEELNALQDEYDANTIKVPDNALFSRETISLMKEAVAQWAESSGVLQSASSTAANGIKDVFDTLSNSLKQAIKDVVTGSKTIGEAFRSIGVSILDAMLDVAVKMAANAMIQWLLETLASTFGFKIPGMGKNPSTKTIPKGKAAGGVISGGVPNRDSVPVLAEPGEFVFRKTAVDMIGVDTLRQMNATGKMAQSGAMNVIQATKREPDMVNVYVIPPEEKPQLSEKDIVIALQRNVARGGPMKGLIRQVAVGQI